MFFELIPYAHLTGPEWNLTPDEILTFVAKGLLTPYRSDGGILLPVRLSANKEVINDLSRELTICGLKLGSGEYTSDMWRRAEKRIKSGMQEGKKFVNEHSNHPWQSIEFDGEDYERELAHLERCAYFKRAEVVALDAKMRAHVTFLTLGQILEKIKPCQFFEKLKSGELTPVSMINDKNIFLFPFQGDALPYYLQYGIKGGVWWKLYPLVPIHEMILIPDRSKVPDGCVSGNDFIAHYSEMEKMLSMRELAKFEKVVPRGTVQSTGWEHLELPLPNAEVAEAWMEYLGGAVFEVSSEGTTLEPEAEVRNDAFQYSLFQSGSMWKIGPYGEEKHFKRIKGYDLLNFLIEHSDKKEIPARQVYHQGENDPAMPPEYTRPEKRIDAKARAEAADALKDLKKRHDNTEDMEERDRISEQIEKYEKHLRDGQRKIYSKQDENARKNVQKLIRNALNIINKAFEKSAPDLIQELKKITTGHFCCYSGVAMWKLHS